MLAGGFLAFFGIINTPIEVGLEDPNSYREVYTTEVDTGVPGKRNCMTCIDHTTLSFSAVPELI